MAVNVPHLNGRVRYTSYDGFRLDPDVMDWGEEGSHWVIWDWGYINTYLQAGNNTPIPSNFKYCEFRLDVPPPADNLMNEGLLNRIKELWGAMGRGAPIRATMWYKASRKCLIGMCVPTMWHYIIFLEYTD
jgi:hypothetical protein